MRFVITSLLAIAAMTSGPTAAGAAERSLLHQKAPAFVKEVGQGWHLRGDISFSPVAVSPATPAARHRGFEAAPFYLLGGRSQFASWMRSDVEDGRSMNFHGLTASVSGATFSRPLAVNSE